ncbi:MAG: hypothetical protein Q9226_009454, partial [Calogaya cf. arnoldii]
MPAAKRKRGNTPPTYNAPTQSSNAKRVKFSVPVRDAGEAQHSASKILKLPKGILKTKRPREDDEEDGPKPKRKFTLCSQPKVAPLGAKIEGAVGDPNGDAVEDPNLEQAPRENGQDETSAEGATAGSVPAEDDQGGNEGSMIEENPEGSDIAPVNNAHGMPTVESDPEDEWTDLESSASSALEQGIHYFDASDEDTLGGSSDEDDDDDDDLSTNNTANGTFTNGTTSNSNSNLIISDQTLTSRDIPSDAHLSHCKIISCNISTATIIDCRIISCT